jgi:hypothetical protein
MSAVSETTVGVTADLVVLNGDTVSAITVIVTETHIEDGTVP